VDQAGQAFALPLLSLFGGPSHPTYLASDLVLENVALVNGDIVGSLVGGQGQTYLMELLSFNSPYIFHALEEAMLKQTM
jgi:hypothetical protein